MRGGVDMLRIQKTCPKATVGVGILLYRAYMHAMACRPGREAVSPCLPEPAPKRAAKEADIGPEHNGAETMPGCLQTKPRISNARATRRADAKSKHLVEGDRDAVAMLESAHRSPTGHLQRWLQTASVRGR